MNPEDVFCSIIVVVTLIFTYLAGKYDFLNVVCLMMKEYTKKMKEANKDDPHT